MQAHRDLPITSVRTDLLPALMHLGFVVAPRVQGGPTDRESVHSFPLRQLIRPRGPGLDMVEVQLAPYRGPAFRINAGVVPKEGMTTVTGHWPAEEVCVHWLNEFFEMYASAQWRIWFLCGFGASARQCHRATTGLPYKWRAFCQSSTRRCARER